MRDLPRKDYYGILRLPYGSSPAIIKQRYRRLAKHLHPDVNRAPDAAARFREINEAYEILSNPETRAIVDAWTAPASRVHRRSGAPPRAPITPSQVRANEIRNERLVAFGCFAPLAFVAAFFGSVSLASSPSEQVAYALAVALVVGLIAAYGGDRVQEVILWWFSRPW